MWFLYRWIVIREDEFSAAACQLECLHPIQLARLLLIRPHEHSCRAVPQPCQRLLRFEKLRRIGKLRAIPEISAGNMQHVYRNPDIEIKSGRLVIRAIDYDHITRLKVLLNRHREIVRGKNRRKPDVCRMDACQQYDHHSNEGNVRAKRTPKPP